MKIKTVQDFPTTPKKEMVEYDWKKWKKIIFKKTEVEEALMWRAYEEENNEWSKN